MSKIRLSVSLTGLVEGVKPVEYDMVRDGRQVSGISWRLSLKVSEFDFVELRCEEEVAKLVKKHKRYVFNATVDPEPNRNDSNPTPLRINGIEEDQGYYFEDEEDEEYIKARNEYINRKIAESQAQMNDVPASADQASSAGDPEGDPAPEKPAKGGRK